MQTRRHRYFRCEASFPLFSFFDKPFDSMWGTMIQLWDYKNNEIFEKQAGNIPELPAVLEYTAFKDGQVF
jgi:hypothetical protein